MFSHRPARNPFPVAWRRRFVLPCSLESLEERVAPAYFSLQSGGNLLATIQTADSNTDATNTIILAPGMYPVTGGVIQNTVALGTAPNLLTKSLEIVGQLPIKSSSVTIQSNGTNRVFQIMNNAGMSPLAVSFQNLTITGGVATDGGAVGGTAALGGGLLIDGGTVFLSNVGVDGNAARGGKGADATKAGAAGGPGAAAEGAGIYLAKGSLALSASTVDDNQATGGAGGRGSAAPKARPARQVDTWLVSTSTAGIQARRVGQAATAEQAGSRPGAGFMWRPAT